jgi:hypothetical protein
MAKSNGNGKNLYTFAGGGICTHDSAYAHKWGGSSITTCLLQLYHTCVQIVTFPIITAISHLRGSPRRLYTCVLRAVNVNMQEATYKAWL